MLKVLLLDVRTGLQTPIIGAVGDPQRVEKRPDPEIRSLAWRLDYQPAVGLGFCASEHENNLFESNLRGDGQPDQAEKTHSQTGLLSGVAARVTLCLSQISIVGRLAASWCFQHVAEQQGLYGGGSPNSVWITGIHRRIPVVSFEMISLTSRLGKH